MTPIPSPNLTPEEHEALSKRYSIAAIVTPLDDGKFAVFANDRSFTSMVIVDELGLAIAIINRAQRIVNHNNISISPPAHMDPEDFGL